jgi:tRNA (cmo5U34)-methyltransferase
MSVKESFEKDAKNYNNIRKTLIPCYRDFYEIALDIIPFGQDRELRVLDLGAGTGLFANGVARRFPNAQLTLIDISPAMLQVAEKRFSKNDRNRVSFRIDDYAKSRLQGTYDLIISALSIHHLTDDEKQVLFSKIHTILEPGGFFINADQALGENDIAEKLYRHTWLQQIRNKGIEEKNLQAILERMKEDKMSPLSAQLLWTKNAGFIDVTTWYQFYSFVVYSGRKPLSTENC